MRKLAIVVLGLLMFESAYAGSETKVTGDGVQAAPPNAATNTTPDSNESKEVKVYSGRPK